MHTVKLILCHRCCADGVPEASQRYNILRGVGHEVIYTVNGLFDCHDNHLDQLYGFDLKALQGDHWYLFEQWDDMPLQLYSEGGKVWTGDKPKFVVPITDVLDSLLEAL